MNHERVQQILQEALQMDPERRDSFIHDSCQGDASLEQEVRSLLGHEPVKGPRDSTIQDSTAVQPGSPYTKGDRLDGATAFVILRLISAGGFGEVYEAEEVGDVTRRVVVKILKEKRSHSPAIIHRFEMERQFMARVTHPNVVKLVGYGTSADGRPYFAMEHVGGVPLLKYCAKERLPFEKRLGLFIEICKGLQAIHNAGILHLDLKPANILVSEDDHGAYGSGRCTIIDFGIAVQNSRTATDSWRTSAQRKLWGTHGYMSPEMLDGDYNAIDQRSDLWALGVVLTELLTGHNPTADIRDADSLRSSVRERQADLTSTFHKLDSTTTEKLAEEFRTNVQRLRRDLSSELSAVTRKAMSEQRDGRYRSADAMRADVEAILERKPVAAYSDGPIYRVRKWAVRRPWAATSLVLAATAASLLLALAVVLGAKSDALAQKNTELTQNKAELEILHEQKANRLSQLEKQTDELERTNNELETSKDELQRTFEAQKKIVERLDPGELARAIQQVRRKNLGAEAGDVGPDAVRDGLVSTVFEPVRESAKEKGNIDALLLVATRYREITEYEFALEVLDEAEVLNPTGLQYAHLLLERGLVLKETDPESAVEPLETASEEFKKLDRKDEMWRATANLAFVLQKTMSQDKATELAMSIPDLDEDPDVPLDALMHKHTVLAFQFVDAAEMFSAKEAHLRQALAYAEEFYGIHSREHLRKKVNFAMAMSIDFHPRQVEALHLATHARELAEKQLGSRDDDYPWFATMASKSLLSVRRDINPNPDNADDHASPLALMSEDLWESSRNILLKDMTPVFSLRYGALGSAGRFDEADEMLAQFRDRLGDQDHEGHGSAERAAQTAVWSMSCKEDQPLELEKLLRLYELAMEDAATARQKLVLRDERRKFYKSVGKIKIEEWKKDADECIRLSNSEDDLDRTPVDHARLLLEIADEGLLLAPAPADSLDVQVGDDADEVVIGTEPLTVRGWWQSQQSQAMEILRTQAETLASEADDEQARMDRLGVLLLLFIESGKQKNHQEMLDVLDRSIDLAEAMREEATSWSALQLRVGRFRLQSFFRSNPEQVPSTLPTWPPQQLEEERSYLQDALNNFVIVQNNLAEKEIELSPWLEFDILNLLSQLEGEGEVKNRRQSRRIEVATNRLYKQVVEVDSAMKLDLDLRLLATPEEVEGFREQFINEHGSDHELVNVLPGQSTEQEIKWLEHRSLREKHQLQRLIEIDTSDPDKNATRLEKLETWAQTQPPCRVEDVQKFIIEQRDKLKTSDDEGASAEYPEPPLHEDEGDPPSTETGDEATEDSQPEPAAPSSDD